MDTSSQAAAPSMIGMDKPKSNAAPTIILWITFVLSLAALIYLFIAGRSMANLVLSRTSDKDQLVSELSSPSYTDIETRANSFKQAFTALSSLSATRKPKSEVLPDLYKNFTKDVKIKNVAISADGTLTVDGTTASYRSVADFMMGLKSYSKISDVKLGATSLNTAEGVSAKEKVLFSVSAKLDLSKEVVMTDTTSVSEDGSTPETVTPAQAQ